MFLERLEINGFKSFAHKTILEFKPGITAIVGPNGSGKSNLADAIRWVLGEQSIKLLRGKKSEDVIFSGSDKKARLGMAEVSLYFNNEDDKANIGMSEICVTHKLYRNGESEYLINKQKSRLIDIQILLAKAGMAQSSYSIIGQGMINNFLLASPQDRKEFFEEASGIKPLQIKRQQSLNKLGQVEENLETAQIQLKEITPRLNSLTRQIRRLERRAEIKSRLKDIQQEYYGSLWHAIYKDWQTQDNQLKEIASQQEILAKQVNNLQNEMVKLVKNDSKSADFEETQELYQKKLGEKMKLNEELTLLKIQSAQADKNKNNAQLPYGIGQKISSLAGLLQELGIKINEALKAGDLKQLRQIFNKQQETINQIQILLKPFVQNGKGKESQDKIKMESKISEIKKQIKEVDDQIGKIQDKIRQGNNKEKEERSQIWELQQKLQQKQSKLNKVSQETNNLRVKLAHLETKKDDLEQEIAQELGGDWLKEKQSGNWQPQIKMDENEKLDRLAKINKLKRELELIGGIDPEIQQEYEEIKTRHEFLSKQTDDLKKSIEALKKLILDLNETIEQRFGAKFKIINQEFQKYFKILFAGGRAKLILLKDKQENKSQKIGENGENIELENEETDESETDKIKEKLKSTAYFGVDIEATPPGKKLKSINMLSGGERALTSIALLCAIITINPSPFILLDEVDAALDEANALRFAEIIKELSKKSQLIIITHNRATMEKSDILYGITMGDDGVSKLLSLKLETAEKYTNR